MSQLPTLRQTFKTEVLNIYSLTLVLIISFLYFSLSVLLLNYKLVISSILGDSPLSFKLNILTQLLIGSYSAFSFGDFVLLIITSVLVGLNILLIYKTITALKAPGVKLSFAVGGSTVFGIVVAGCSSCGFSILSLLGITGALTFIPFGAISLHFIAIGLLLFSFWYSLKNYHKKIVCKLN